MDVIYESNERREIAEAANSPLEETVVAAKTRIAKSKKVEKMINRDYAIAKSLDAEVSYLIN